MLAYSVRYCYWLLGGYREYRRIRWSQVRRLVFVCRGNICRSPYAEYLGKDLGLNTSSTGVDALNGVSADASALSVARDRSISLQMHRTTSIDDFVPQDGDLFVAMEPSQAAVLEGRRWGVTHQITLFGLWVEAHGPMIPDPYGQDERFYAKCFSLIEVGIDRMKEMMVP